MELNKNKNLVLLGYPRTGSTVILYLLEKYLKSHINLSEYFNLGTEIVSDDDMSIVKVIHHHDGKLYNKTHAEKMAEFKSRYELLSKLDTPYIIKFFGDFVLRCPNIANKFLNDTEQFICLNRRDRIKSALSYFIAFKNKKWHSLNDGDINNVKLFFSKSDELIMNGCLARMFIYDLLATKYKDKIIMVSDYDDFQDDVSIIENKLNRLFVPHPLLKTPLKKQNYNHEASIINFDTFKIYYDEFFDDIKSGEPSDKFRPEWWPKGINVLDIIKS